MLMENYLAADKGKQDPQDILISCGLTFRRSLKGTKGLFLKEL